LSELVERTGDQPAILLDWAKLLGWMADDEGMRTVLRRFAALDVPLDDAVEAEMLAMLLDDAPLGDSMPVLTLTWTVRDAEKLQERFLSSPLMASLRVDGFQASDDEPPPRAAYLLIDRPQPAADETATLENIPSWYAQILFYGKQTDREARLVVTQVSAAMVDRAIGQIAEIAGDAIAPEVAREEAGMTSASLDLLERRWHFTRGMSREDAEQLIVAHERRALLEQWPHLKTGAFGGKSPAEAAGDPAMRVKLLAAIGLLEPMRKWVDLDDLRRSLGLPTREAIDPAEQPPLSIALLRLDRLMIEKLSDDDLLTAFRRAIVFGVLVAMRKFSREFLSRPSMAEHPDRMQAYSVAVRTAETPAESLQYIDEARKAVEAKGESGAQWDLIELTHYLTVGNGPEAMRLIQHIERNHIQEPNVGEALMRMLINFGLLRPDGTPNIPTRGGAPMSAPEPAAEPNQIWTPEAEQGGGGGKLWVPD
jgi:hypothetical protein